MPTIEEQAEQIRIDAGNAVTVIRNNARISDIEKRDQIAKVWLDGVDRMTQLEENGSAAGNKRKQELERKLYGLPTSTDASLAISYRDALDRATALPDGDEQSAITLLNRALTSGDTTLARATLAVAFERQWVDLINNYIEAVPSTNTDIEELWAISTTPLASMFTFIPPAQPLELAGQHQSRIRSWAEGTY